MIYYNLRIAETARSSLKEEPSLFNVITKKFNKKDRVRDYLKERYGRMPSMKNKIYVDDEEGHQTEVGFTYSFWNTDFTHNSKSWFQTDWITLEKVLSRPTTLKAIH